MEGIFIQKIYMLYVARISHKFVSTFWSRNVSLDVITFFISAIVAQVALCHYLSTERVGTHYAQEHGRLIIRRLFTRVVKSETHIANVLIEVDTQETPFAEINRVFE
jgi:hypothetical protein